MYWEDGYVYLLECNNLYKIWYTKWDPEKRIKNLQTWNTHKSICPCGARGVRGTNLIILHDEYYHKRLEWEVKLISTYSPKNSWDLIILYINFY